MKIDGVSKKSKSPSPQNKPAVSNGPAKLTSNGAAPFSRFVNVELCKGTPGQGATGNQATVMLENPHGDFPIGHAELLHQVSSV